MFANSNSEKLLKRRVISSTKKEIPPDAKDIESFKKAGAKIEEVTRTGFLSGDHDGKTCEQVKKERDSKTDPSELLIRGSTVQCPNPKCELPLSRIEGCNSVQCSKCSQWLCYACKKGCPFVQSGMGTSTASSINHAWIFLTCGIFENQEHEKKKIIEKAIDTTFASPQKKSVACEKVNMLAALKEPASQYQYSLAMLTGIGLSHLCPH